MVLFWLIIVWNCFIWKPHSMEIGALLSIFYMYGSCVYVILTKWMMLYFFLLRDGNSRQFGFVGYRTEGEAEAAFKYFNNSYLDTSRVVCEVCVPKISPESLQNWKFLCYWTTLFLRHHNKRKKTKTKALFVICLSCSITHQLIDQ